MAKAIVLKEYGKSEVLKLEDIKVQKPQENEISIKQTAIGVHFHDVYVRSGLYKTLSLPGIPGLEAAGIVEEVGKKVTNFKPGDKVGYITKNYGAYTSHRNLDHKIAIKIPKSISAELIATNFSNMRIRFSTSNPQDMTIDVIKTMAKYKNICNHIHLPIQSGSDRILKKMNRLHTRQEYLELIKKIKQIIPNCGISHDIMTGFPTETERDHQDTLSLMEEVKYDFGYMFAYSERPGTYAARNFKDDISPETKQRRLEEIITVQQKLSFERNKRFLNNECSVLIDKSSKKSNEFWSGRTSENNVVVFPKYNFSLGDIVDVKVESFTTATLIGDINKVKV